MQIGPGNDWLAAQDAGAVTYTVYTEPRGEEPVDVASIWTTEHEARQHAGGHPIERTERMTGTWIYPDIEPPACGADMFAVEFVTRYDRGDGSADSSSHVAYFGTPEARDAFIVLPFVADCRYPEMDPEHQYGVSTSSAPEPEGDVDGFCEFGCMPIDHEAGA